LNAEVGKKERRWEGEKVRAAFSRDNDGGLAMDCNQKKEADNNEQKMGTILFSDFRIPTSHFKPFRLPTSNHSDFRIVRYLISMRLLAGKYYDK